MHIADNRTILSIQSEFQQKYPFLKIEFFKHAHGAGELSPRGEMISGSSMLSEIRSVHNSGEILIHDDMTVGEVEQKFRALFGVNVQVFRKGKGLWIETSSTDEWTLAKQNQLGDEMTS